MERVKGEAILREGEGEGMTGGRNIGREGKYTKEESKPRLYCLQEALGPNTWNCTTLPEGGKTI